MGLSGFWHSVFSFLFFCLEATVKRTIAGRERFCHGYGNYIQNAILKVAWYQLFSKFLTTKSHIDNDTLTLKILRKWINIRVNCFLDKYDKAKMSEGALEIVSGTKIGACSWSTLDQDISLIIVFLFFCETNLVFKFNVLLIK